MQHIIVSTCGISLLTNGSSFEERSRLNALSNKTQKELDSKEKQFIDSVWSQRSEQLLQLDLQDVRRASAELNTLIAYFHGLPDLKDRCIFLHTDTYMGKCCTEALHAWMATRGLNSELCRFSGMNTVDFESFNLAMSDLARWCAWEIAPLRSSGCRVIFNLTGGFKSLQGFMQTLGMFYADESIYLFETSDHLLHIPRLPLNIDQSALEIVAEHEALFRRLALGVKEKADNLAFLPETLLLRVENEAVLSPWGELYWSQYRSDKYGTKLFEAPLAEIRYTEKFQKNVEKIASDTRRIFILNERIDDLARYILFQQNISRLDFKAYKGNSMKPSTHEFDAWANDGAWRVFCHMEGDVCCLDQLLPHPKE